MPNDGGDPRKIELRGVCKAFQPRKNAPETLALQDVSLSVADGEFVCLLGPSGCGKSTVLNLTAGFEKPSKGDVLLEGRPIGGPGPDRGVVFQEPMLFPWLTVFDNVTLVHECMAGPPTNTCPRRSSSIQRVGFERHRPYELSGGMKQRAALARAWIGSPHALLMDGLFAALDAQTRLMIREQLVQLWEQSQITVVFVTHDVEETILLADRAS